MSIVWFNRASVHRLSNGARQTFDRWSLRSAWVFLFLLLLAGLPLFLCMPLYADVTTFDLGARNLLRGGVHYRDAYDNGLPGMVWLHVGIRAALGWRAEAIRLVDFLIVALCVGMLVLWLRSQDLPTVVQVWTGVILFGFYWSTSEVCHCQRDMWMLLPALAALHLRRRQVAALLVSSGPWWSVRGRAGIEGFCWGIAFWVKPFVAIPALACWLFATVLIWRRSAQGFRVLATDSLGLLAGGLLAGLPGIAWLWWSGSWSFFWDTVIGWDYDYFHAATQGVIERTRFLLREFQPWGWVHVAASLIAVLALRRAFVPPPPTKTASPSGPWQEGLLASFYVAWLAQANYLQYGYLYHLAPAVLLSLTLVAGRRWLPGSSLLGWIILAGFLALAINRHPLVDFRRTSLWARCCREGSSSELQNRLALNTEPRRPDWVALDRVAAFLKGRGVGDGELTCYSFGTTPLYLQLNLQPSTRFVSGIEDMIAGSPHRRDIVRAELAASPQRYVVTDLQFLAADLQGAGLLLGHTVDGSGSEWTLSPDFPQTIRRRYPWSEPVLFRADPYLVHQDTGSLRR